jgi:hypothetical protein
MGRLTEKLSVDWMNSGKPYVKDKGNPELSLWYTKEKCNDYWVWVKSHRIPEIASGT